MKKKALVFLLIATIAIVSSLIAYKFGTPTGDGNVDYVQTQQAVLPLGDGLLDSEGEVIYELNNYEDTHEVELVSFDGGITKIRLNGVLVDSTENVSSLAISVDGKYLYYTKFEIPEEGDEDIGGDIYSESSGQIFKMSTDTLKEEKMYEFPDFTVVKMGANGKYLFYTTNIGKIGVIDLTSNEDTLLYEFIPEHYDATGEIVLVTDTEAHMYLPNDYSKLLVVRFETLGVSFKYLSH